MDQGPSKRNVNWNGGSMGEQQHYDRPAPYLIATSAPKFEDDELSVGNTNCCHYCCSRFRPGIDGTNRASNEPEHDPYQCQEDRDVFAVELSRAVPQDPIRGSQKCIADNDRPEIGDRATENDDKRRRDRRGYEPRAPQSQRRYPSVL